MDDIDTRINNLYERLRVLWNKDLDLLFKISFDRRIPLRVCMIIKDIELGIGGIFDKK